VRSRRKDIVRSGKKPQRKHSEEWKEAHRIEGNTVE
jgi:hypothetical protein